MIQTSRETRKKHCRLQKTWDLLLQKPLEMTEKRLHCFRACILEVGSLVDDRLKFIEHLHEPTSLDALEATQISHLRLNPQLATKLSFKSLFLSIEYWLGWIKRKNNECDKLWIMMRSRMNTSRSSKSRDHDHLFRNWILKYYQNSTTLIYSVMRLTLIHINDH